MRHDIAIKLKAALTIYAQSKKSSANPLGLKLPEPGEEESYLDSISRAAYYLQQPMITIAKFAKALKATYLPAQQYFDNLQLIIQQHVESSPVIKVKEVLQTTRNVVADVIAYASETAAQLIKTSDESQRSDAEKILGEALSQYKQVLKQNYLEREIVQTTPEKLLKLAEIYIEITYKIDFFALHQKLPTDSYKTITESQDYDYKNEYAHALSDAVNFMKSQCEDLSDTAMDQIMVNLKACSEFLIPSKVKDRETLSQRLTGVFAVLNDKHAEIKSLEEAEEEKRKRDQHVLEMAALKLKADKKERELGKQKVAAEKQQEELAKQKLLMETQKEELEKQKLIAQMQQEDLEKQKAAREKEKDAFEKQRAAMKKQREIVKKQGVAIKEKEFTAREQAEKFEKEKEKHQKTASELASVQLELHEQADELSEAYAEAERHRLELAALKPKVEAKQGISDKGTTTARFDLRRPANSKSQQKSSTAELLTTHSPVTGKKQKKSNDNDSESKEGSSDRFSLQSKK